MEPAHTYGQGFGKYENPEQETSIEKKGSKVLNAIATYFSQEYDEVLPMISEIGAWN